MPSTVIVITGISASGKTTIGRQIAHHFRLPILSKDDVKERIFDGLGYSDRDFSRRAGQTAYSLLYHFARELLRSSDSFVIESNFNPKFDDAIFRELSRAYAPRFVQVLCHADGEVLLGRFQARIASGERHPGHGDTIDEHRSYLLSGRCDPLDIGGRLLTVDTTDFSRVDIAAILADIETDIRP